MTNTNTDIMSQLVYGDVHWLDFAKTATKTELFEIIEDLKQYKHCFENHQHRIKEIRELLIKILLK